MTNSEHIVRRRMYNLRLLGPPLKAPEEVVRWLGAVQSQDYGPAKWSVVQRGSGVKDTDVDKALADGAILRTHVLRPTWHFVVPADIRWMLQLTSPRIHAMNAYYYRQLGLDETVFKKSRAVFARALRGGNHLRRKQLAELLERAGIEASGLRLGYILMNAELNGFVCSGGLSGKQQTYALLDERVPEVKSLSREDALAELTLRYFTSHGPATLKDFKWWSSLTVAEIKTGLEMVASKLEDEDVDGVSYWSAPSKRHSMAKSPSVHLLQGYDEYIVGYSESKFLLDPTGGTRSLPEGRIVFNGVVILDGKVAGHWKRTPKKDSVIIEVAHYLPLNRSELQALQLAAHRHGQFLNLPARLVRTRI